MTATASQAWAVLKRHARDEMATLRLQDLCNDNDRVSSLVVVHNSESTASSSSKTDGNPNRNSMILVDLSRQRMTLETLNHLLKLSVTRKLRKYIHRLAWGQNNPDWPILLQMQQQQQQQSQNTTKNAPHARYQHYASTIPKKSNDSNLNTAAATSNNENNPSQENDTDFPAIMPSMHLALRAPQHQGLHMLTHQGINALTAIHRDWDRLERLSESIRRGAWRGANGRMIRDVVIIGRGVAVQALKFIHEALEYDEAATMARKFGLDGSAAAPAPPGSSADVWNHLKRGLGAPSSSSTCWHNAGRRMHFLTSVDPLVTASLVATLDAGSTLVISWALQGTEETGLATKTMKIWLLQHLNGNAATSSASQPYKAGPAHSRKVDSILSKHMLLITGNDQMAANINKPESVFVLPDHSRCEGFLNFSAATLLPLSIVFGWSLCEEFLAGGHDLDCHFVETNPRHNLPVLLALMDVWNDIFLGANSSGRVVTPYAQSMKGFPAFVAALEAQTCSGRTRSHGNSNTNTQIACSSLVLDGGIDSAYDRAIYQSSKIQNTELVMVMNTQLQANVARTIAAQGIDDVYHHADAQMCALFGHADEMAFGGGKDSSINNSNDASSTHDRFCHDSSSYPQQSSANSSPSEGNRPSSLLICGKLDAFACGQLIALSEHRAAVKARIWDLDPFAGDAGYALKTARTEQLRDELEKIFVAQDVGPESDDDEGGEAEGLSLSTKTILQEYAKVRS